MATKTWAERFPHPGEAPERPQDEHPEEAEALHQWWQDCYAWNSYVQAARRHEIARAVAHLDAKRAGMLGPGGPVDLSAAEIVAMNVGACFLDGTIADAFLLGPTRSEDLPKMGPL